MGDKEKQIYHERQRLQFCLLHSLNNLFQGYTILMLARSSERVSFRPDGKKTTMPHEQKSGKRVDGSRTKFAGTCRIRLPKRSDLSSVKYMKYLGDKAVAVMHFMSTRRRASTKVSSSGTPKPCVAPIDSCRAEAIDDCIEFINSSSTFQRSNYVSC